MSSRFDSWFSDFVTQHNLPAAGRTCDKDMDIEYKVDHRGVPVSRDDRHVREDSVVRFNPRASRMDRNPSLS